MANYDPYNEGFRDGLAVAKQMLLVEQERIGPSLKTMLGAEDASAPAPGADGSIGNDAQCE